MIYSFPDDTNPYIWDSTLKSVQESYNTILSKLLVGLKWIILNFMSFLKNDNEFMWTNLDQGI